MLNAQGTTAQGPSKRDVLSVLMWTDTRGVWCRLYLAHRVLDVLRHLCNDNIECVHLLFAFPRDGLGSPHRVGVVVLSVCIIDVRPHAVVDGLHPQVACCLGCVKQLVLCSDMQICGPWLEVDRRRRFLCVRPHR